jgi:uncharacterized protein (TIGR03067 family)
MRLLAPILLPVILAPLPKALQATQAKQAARDEERVVGTWEAVSSERGGKKLPRDEEIFRFAFTADGKFSLRQKGPDDKANGTYKLSPRKKPKEIDLVAQGERILGIYVFEGDNLKLCLAEPAQARPTAFATSERGTLLIVLKRSKK